MKELILKCKNNENHKRFTAIAHVTQEWVTDENGKFEKVLEDCIDVLHSPNSEDNWECYECGSEVEAEFK